MPFTAIDDAPAGFTALDDAPSGFTPLDDEQSQGPAPEGAVMSAVRTGLSSIVPAIGTALGAAGAGLLATPETVGLGTIPAAVAGGAAGGFAGKELQDYVLGPDFVAQNEAQMAANRKAHEIASGAGEIVPTLVSMAGGGGAVPKLLGIGERAVAAAGLQAGTKEAEAVAAKAISDATSGFTPSAIAIRSAESALGGARLGASQTAQQPDATVGDFANNIAKSAVEFGPLGILPHAETLAKALGYSVPQSAITTLAGNAYDALVNGQPMDFQKIKDQGLANVIPFALFNAVAHGVGMAGNLAPKDETKAPEVEHELDAPIAQAAAAGQPKTAEALAGLKANVEQKKGEAADIFPPNENTENRPVETDDQGNTGPSLLGTEGGETTTPATEAAPEIPDPFNPQPVEENALPIESPSGVLQHPQEGTGEAGGERERVEPSEQGEEAATEGQSPTEGADAQNGGEEFGLKNEVMDAYLKAHGIPEVPEGTGADVVKRIADTRQDYLDNPKRAFDIIKKFQDDPSLRPSIEEQGILDNHFVTLDRQVKLAEIEARNENLTEDQRQEAANRAEVLDEHVADLADVARKLGTHWSDEGRARQVTLDQDYGVIRQIVRRTRLKGGELTPEELKQTRQESQEYEAQAKKTREMEQANAEAAKAEAGERVIEGIKKKPTIKKISRTDVEEKIRQSLVKPKEDIQASLAPEKRVTPVEDRAYLDAVSKGDTETAQRMVDEAAKEGLERWRRIINDALPSDVENASEDELAKFRSNIKDVFKKEGLDASFSPRTGSWYIRDRDGFTVSVRDHGVVADAFNGYTEPNHVIHVSDANNILDLSEGLEEAATEFLHRPITRDANGRVIPLSERFNPESNDIRFSKVHSTTPSEGEPNQVTTEHQKEAISDLQKSQIGKTLLRGTVIVPDWQRVISNDELNRGFSTSEMDTIKRSEGFYDPQSGKAVVIRENVIPRENETPAEAIKRVILHERIGHEGMRWMLDNDPKFRKAWHEAAAKIPQTELDEIAKTYGHLGGNSDQLIGEWFARQAERLDPNEIPDPKTVFGKMWQAVKDFLARYFGNETDLDQKVRDLVGQIVRNPDAFEGRKGLEGDLETQHSLPKEEDRKNPLDKLPHSVLDLLARYHVQEGAKTEPELTKAMRETLKTHFPDVTESDVRRAHSQYGKTFNPSKDELVKTVADLKGQQRLLSGLEDVQKGSMAKLKGLIARKTSPEYRALEKTLNDEIVAKRLRKQDETQRSSPLDKKISTLENAIADTQKEINDLRSGGSVKIRQRSKVLNDAEADRLEKVLKDKRAERDQIITERNRITKEAQKAQNDLDDAQAKAIQLEVKLDSGDLSVNPVKQKAVFEELQSIRDQIKGLNKAISKARSDSEKPIRDAKAAAKELADAKERVAELERKRDSGDLSVEERSKRNIPAELAAEREKIAELNKEIATKRSLLTSHTPPTEQEYREAIAENKKNNAAKIAENEKRIAAGDFAPRPKKKPFSDDEIELQKMKLLKQREKIQQGNLALQKANRTKVQKFFDGAVNLKEAMVLSSAAVYGKLSAAAVVKSGLTGLEDLQGGILKKILPKAVSKGAKIESGSSAKALGQAFSRAFSKGMKDAADTLKTGKTDLDLKYGKPKALDEGWTSLLGRMHGFIKAPVKRLAFEYAQAKQYENYLKEGVDVSSDPLLMEKVALKSYEYANRAIFMNDNGLSQTWNLALNHLLKKGGGWAGLGRAMRILLPIIKVPTNIALEAGLYAGGIPIGLFKLAKAWKAGIDNVSDEESEAIHRALKKGSLGSALMLMGFFNPQMFGGYYQKGIKRKDNEAEYGGMQINGENIPKWLLHSPAFEVLQMGATARRVADSRFHGQQRGLSSGALAGAIGLASEVPFVSEMLRTGDLESPEGRSKYFGELAKAQVIPAALDQLARHQDHTSSGKPIKREPRNFTEVLKSGVPGLREQVPAKKPPKTP